MDTLLNIDAQKVTILGVGTNAKILSKIVEDWGGGTQIITYIISDDQNYDVKEYDGIPILKMSECNEDIKEYPVIISVRECFISKVKSELEQFGFKKVISVENYKEWLAVLEHFYKSYFKDRGIDISKPFIEIEGNRFRNFFELDNEGKYSCLCEIGDIILPIYFDDFSVFIEGPYELKEIGFGVEQGDVVLDCGANMGLFSACVLNRGGCVYGFEPTPHTREYLSVYEEMFPNQMHIEPYACSNENGETEFYVDSHLNGENSINNLFGTCNTCITVKMKTIDSFVRENNLSKIDFIKADIEGAERYMLMGAKETLQRFAPKLSICTYHLEDDPQVLENIIFEANPDYKVIHKYKKLYAYVEK